MNRIQYVVLGIALAACSLETLAVEPRLDKGTHELTVQGFADFEKSSDYWYFADIGYGYFVKKGLELGVTLSLEGSDNYDRFSLGPFVEYNFLLDSAYVPYVSLGAQWINADIQIGGDDRLIDSSTDALLLDAEAGIKFFLSDNIALSTGLAYEWATDDVFDAKDDVDSGNGLLKVGMRFYL